MADVRGDAGGEGRPGPPRRGTGAARWLGLAVLSLLLACSEDSGPRPLLVPAGYGVVEGVLRGMDDPSRCRAFLTAADDDPEYASMATRCDSSGAYSIRAPYGRYRLRFDRGYETPGFYYSADGPVLDGGAWIKLDRTRERVRADLTLGRLHVRLLLPEPFRGTTVGVAAIGSSPSGWRYRAYGRALCDRDTVGVSVEGLVPATYRLYADVGVPPSSALPFGCTETTAARFEVGQETVVTPVFAVPAPGAVVMRVRGSWQVLGDLGSRPVLRVFGPDTLESLGLGADADGRIEGRILWSRPVRFAVQIGDVVRWIGGPTYGEASVYNPAPGEMLTLPEVVESGLAVRLELENPLGGMFAAVRIFRGSAGGDPLGTTDVFGNLFAFSNLDPGVYYLQILARYGECENDWRPEWYEGAASAEEATAILVTEAGDVVRREWRLGRGGRLRGIVTPPPNYEDWGRYVELLSVADSTQALCGRYVGADQTGYEFTGLADGLYVLRMEFPLNGRRRNWWYPGTRDRLQADTLEVRSGETVEASTWPGR